MSQYKNIIPKLNNYLSNDPIITDVGSTKSNIDLLIKKKSIYHTNIINNTIDNLLRLEVKFVTEDIRKFLFSTRFIFQNLEE